MAELPALPPLSKIPVHVAIIMDGNGRWANKRGLPRLAGHRAGTENLRKIIRASVEFGVKHLTLYAFSTENWNRPKEEIEGLLKILEEVVDKELAELCEEGVRLDHIGHLSHLGAGLKNKIQHAMELTRENTTLFLHLAFSYGSRDELVCMVQKIVEEGIPAGDINEQVVSDHLFTAGTPDPDLIIRTSGEVRSSNFLLWQGAYSEWYFPTVLWPDFGRLDFYRALEEYSRRDRRFGKVNSQGKP